MSRRRHTQLSIIAKFSMLLVSAITSDAAAKPFRIQVIDQDTSRGIPLVILETSLNTLHVTDSNGVVAYEDSIAMGREVFFKPVSHGYTFPAPGLAMGGTVLKPMADSSATLVMKRDMIAERLYRITGAGIYRDTLALGEAALIAEPLINAGVVGQDSTLCTPIDGKLLWLWGDTSKLGHPLAANFRTTCAYSDFPTSGGLPVEQGINLQYFTRGDFVKPMMPLRHGRNSEVYWLSCLMTVPDSQHREHVLAWWSRIENPDMKTVERGIAEFDPETLEFKPIVDYPTTVPLQPGGHAVRDGDYFVFTHSGEHTRVRATYEDASDPLQYEAFTCLENDGPFTTTTAKIARGPDSKALFSWRKNTSAIGPAQQRDLLTAGLLKAEECTFRPIDVETGKPFLPHASSISWNPYRQKWTMILSELMGTSMVGEVWYLEADSVTGPWGKAVKVLTHSNYSFYNPLQHPELNPSPDSRHVYFEGTYTKTSSGNEVGTPYYDYNQVMYRLDLDDPRLHAVRH